MTRFVCESAEGVSERCCVKVIDPVPRTSVEKWTEDHGGKRDFQEMEAALLAGVNLRSI
jgi:hypothetical protein